MQKYGQDQIDPWGLESMAEEDMPKPEFIISSGSFATIKDRNSVGVLIDTFKLTDHPSNEANFENAGTRIVHFMAGGLRGMDNIFGLQINLITRFIKSTVWMGALLVA